MGYWGYPRYVSVAEKKAKAAKKMKQLRKKNPDIRPVIIEGRAIATTWWGKSWNVNLERYADYENRIGRGRSYVRHGTVLDLRIEQGQVTSLVQGTASKPYSVTVNIKELPSRVWKRITVACEGKLNSLQELLMGKFPKALNEIFTAQGKGLFPSPKEISFSCSCPDWAYMCKHVAATLYGIGARLDEEPSLFFKLRKVEMNDLISRAVEDKTQKLLKKARRKSSKIIDDSRLSDVFGIDLEDHVPAKPKTPKAKSKTQAKKTAVEKPAKVTRDDIPPIEVVVGIIKKSKNGVGIATLRRKSGFDEKKIYSLVHRLKKQGRIKNVSWGVYAGV
ncbi:MAG: hypothetical protein U9M96_04055 [Thermodesulfobacteriota bacterium]|nr:hypothetical protein [Thermodesulfobacteriota bacterium]